MTAAKTSLLKWIRLYSNLVAFIPIHWKCEIKANFPVVDFLGTGLKFRKRTKNSSSLVCIFTSQSCCDDNKMYKKAWRTCKVVVLLIKPIAFLPFSFPSPLLKLLNSDFPYWLFLNTYLNKREGLKPDVGMNRSSLDVRLGRRLHELHVHTRCPSIRDKKLPQNGFMFTLEVAYT